MSTTGGDRLKEYIRKAKQASPIDGVDVGFFESARYPSVRTGKDGGQPQTPHYVATVAAWQEFGTKPKGRPGTPERPAIRRAVRKVEQDVKDLVAAEINSATGQMDADLAGKLGEMVKGAIQEEITELRDPPNAPKTIERKGSSNPLIDTTFMRNSVTWNIIQD